MERASQTGRAIGCTSKAGPSSPPPGSDHLGGELVQDRQLAVRRCPRSGWPPVRQQGLHDGKLHHQHLIAGSASSAVKSSAHDRWPDTTSSGCILFGKGGERRTAAPHPVR